MIKYIVNEVAPLGANCYTVYDTESKNCLIIDLGGDFSFILNQTSRLGLKVKGVVLTHGHFDHSAGAVNCKEMGIPVYVSKDDYGMLQDMTNMSEYFGFGKLSFCADFILPYGETEIGGIKINVLKTSGHTEGSVCLLIDGKLYSGDTIFYNSYGRCDLPTGSFSKLKKSITEVVFSLPDHTEILAGHGEKTTVGYERKYNPINEDNY
ncbi:MAG: MBL fold metallo-hydrolase [Clostridiales bacterium]|nr:MBL fold metallo-hydrolase [Clostridiales bacterium]